MDALVECLQRYYPAPQAPRSQFWFWIDEERPAPLIRDIQRAVVEDFGETMHELLSTSQRHDIVLPRYVGMYLSRRLTRHGLHPIGRAFRRDHTIVVVADKKISARMVADAEFASRVSRLEARFA